MRPRSSQNERRGTVSVSAPTAGVLTRIPTDQAARTNSARTLSVGTNVRAREGVLSNAPGFELAGIKGTALDSTCLAIAQPALGGANLNLRVLLIATKTAVYSAGMGTNQAPVVTPGNPQVLTGLAPFGLTASATDADSSDTITWFWTKLSGPACSFSSQTVQNPTVTPSAYGIYVFQVTAYDGTIYVGKTTSVETKP